MIIKKKYLINLDSYQLDIYGDAIKKIITKLNDDEIKNIAIHCASIDDKNKIKKILPGVIIFCGEDYVKKNFSLTEYNNYKELIEKLNISFGEINYSLSVYKKFYYHTRLNPDIQLDLDLKRTILFYNFYDEIFKNFKPNIVIHEHTGGLGSKILWEKCKQNNCKYF